MREIYQASKYDVKYNHGYFKGITKDQNIICLVLSESMGFYYESSCGFILSKQKPLSRIYNEHILDEYIRYIDQNGDYFGITASTHYKKNIIHIMKYKINIKYQTGNSFNINTEEQCIELSWDNISVAEENLNRIKEHYEYFNKLNSSYYWKLKKEDILKEVNNKPWFRISEHDKLGQYGFNLKTDDGKEFPYCPFWTGYFERLYEANIVLSDEYGKVSFY